jgi:hypothetical protein
LKKTYNLLRVISIIFGISITHVWADNDTLNFQILNYTNYSTIYDESTRNDKLGVSIVASAAPFIPYKGPIDNNQGILNVPLSIGEISPPTGIINHNSYTNSWNILVKVASDNSYYLLYNMWCSITSDDFASGKPVRIFIYRTNLSSDGAYSTYIEKPVSPACEYNLDPFI